MRASTHATISALIRRGIVHRPAIERHVGCKARAQRSIRRMLSAGIIVRKGAGYRMARRGPSPKRRVERAARMPPRDMRRLNALAICAEWRNKERSHEL